MGEREQDDTMEGSELGWNEHAGIDRQIQWPRSRNRPFQEDRPEYPLLIENRIQFLGEREDKAVIVAMSGNRVRRYHSGSKSWVEYHREDCMMLYYCNGRKEERRKEDV